MLAPTTWIHPALAGCLLYNSVASGSYVGIEGPSAMNFHTGSIHDWIFGFLLIFCCLAGFYFLGALVIVFSAWEENEGLFSCFLFLITSCWFVQLIIYAEYAWDVYKQNYFPHSAFAARYMLDQLTDLFVIGTVLYIVHCKWRFRYKWALDASLTIMHAAAIGYTTASLVFSAANPEDDSKHLQWLTSYYVFTALYALVVANVATTLYVVKANRTTNANVSSVGFKVLPLAIHALFRAIMAIVYSQYKNPKIDYDVLRLFEIIVLNATNWGAILVLVSLS